VGIRRIIGSSCLRQDLHRYRRAVLVVLVVVVVVVVVVLAAISFVLACKSLTLACLQIHYHGYVGTIGASYIDYYVGDRVITPPDFAHGHTEKLALHSLSFLGPSHRHIHMFHGRAAAADVFKRRNTFSQSVAAFDSFDSYSQRAAWGVQSNGLLVCYFNQHFKIDPVIFAVWTRVMRRFNDSVFWMLEGNVASERHLRREWVAAGLESSRLVFANRSEPDEHISRAALCDLAVDTPMYNSGATAADTLFAGVPIITRPSAKLAGRMASSMMRGAGLGQLTVTRNNEDYEALMVNVMSSWPKLSMLRQRLQRYAVPRMCDRVCSPATVTLAQGDWWRLAVRRIVVGA
jgi:protein O-GlcNAc transferase